jgi:ubiquinone/menaquinone biosynthesis C-methylase UbiE
MQNHEDEQHTTQSAARRMKDEWNSRAIENAKWYINTVGVDQTDEEFFASGLNELQKWWLPDFRAAFPDTDLRALRVFEMGCGIGRMTSHLANVFGEVWAVDVSGEMIAQARSRFGQIPNIRWIETQGVDLRELPDDFFDLGFSIYVYQHMPDKEAIAANIAAAYRKLRRGGLYKFHTNGIVNSEYEALEKDTWVGAAFPEVQIRQLAAQLGAQLLSIQGSGTQYCWATLRKGNPPGIGLITPTAIDIAYAGRADLVSRMIPVEGEDARICVLVTGVDRERVDCNTIGLVVGEVPAVPVYAGPVLPQHARLIGVSDVGSGLVAIEAGVPYGLPTGKTEVTIEWNGVRAKPREIELVAGTGNRPKIVTVRNGSDFGTDVYAAGPKSLLNLYVEGLDGSACVESVTLELSGQAMTPEFVGFVPENGTWQVNARLAPKIQPGSFTLVLRFNGLASDPVELRLR